MFENDQDVKGQGTSIQAGEDVIGVNVTSDKNIIGSNIDVSQISSEIKKKVINRHTLSRLDEEYADAFIQITESPNNQIKHSREVTPEEIAKVQNSLEDLAKET